MEVGPSAPPMMAMAAATLPGKMCIRDRLMRQMVRAGWLGVKTGKGFFDYDGPFGKEIVKK